MYKSAIPTCTFQSNSNVQIKPDACLCFCVYHMNIHVKMYISMHNHQQNEFTEQKNDTREKKGREEKRTCNLLNEFCVDEIFN